ncbi:hypothetical protein BN946_scf184920.g9 [Trametes cinnabarina]|uniref:HNH nuclease domain-containing protein n=1 Tax=Pycnoporus cinnabarinus TaxID=5643 RepID=A0A060SBJ6_PYCCI|nr:hypothetical protein BN946_scf184920.g9 [Trametes cinnabarina]
MSLARNLHKGQSLPGNVFPSGSQEHTAYERCRQLEQHTAWNEFVDDLRSDLPFEEILKSMTPIVAARVLGFGLVHAPNDSGRDALVRDILSCDRTELGVLAYLYVFGLIRVFYNPKGPTPAVTPALSPRLSLEAAAQDPHVLQPSSSNAAVLRSQTLLRDNHRCVFTGIIDAQSYLANIAADVDPGTMALATNVAHIISQSIAENIDGVPPAQQAKFQWARTAGAMIERFGGFNAHEVLGHDNLHNPKNAFTATQTPHMYFDSLDLWLTPAMDAQGQVVCDTYNVCHADGFGPAIRAAAIKPQVTFRSVVDKGKEIHAPDPRIIELHAACAKIAHMSGAAELLREFYMDMDSIAVMTQPHAAYKLTRALKTLQSISTTAS